MTNKICKVKDCNNKHRTKGLCNRHYLQFLRNNEIKRTIYDKNEYINKGNYSEIILYDRKSKEKARTLIDNDDVNKIKNYKLCLEKLGYVITAKNRKKYFLHQLILPKKEGLFNDHINRDKLDNRKCNLRYATSQENNRNRISKGYYWDKENKKWRAYITINSKQIYLGRFKNKINAINAREKAENRYFGEFKPTRNYKVFN